MSRPPARFRQKVDDFVVDEIPAYAAGGDGEHLFVTLRKHDLTTTDALVRICRALSVEERGAGFAGMKDKRAVTTQTISVPFAMSRSVDEARALELPGIEIVEAARHRHKLKPGHLVGNRFSITLRDVAETARREVVDALDAARAGVPNAFGPQRFGHHGDNPRRALAWLTGQEHGPRGRREQRFLFSSLQSHLFNRVLEARHQGGNWATPLLGDLVKKHDTGGIFECTDPAADALRAIEGQVSPTGPIFGLKMRRPSGKPDEIEREILLREAGASTAFDRHRHLGEGSRRPLRLIPEELRAWAPEEEPGVVRVYFVLPKGGYATTVLAQAVTLVTDDPKGDGTPYVRPSSEGLDTGDQDNAELLEDISG